ncbi:MAG TPA: hypothetical protein VKE22_21380 [Haliangiales bacterium]|nr:hypothetical protein [Haliangiales bacterium]
MRLPGFLIAGPALLVVAWVGYRVAFPDTEPRVEIPPAPRIVEPPPPIAPPPAPVPRPLAPGAFELVDVTGSVEVRRSGRWIDVAPGERLLPAEAVRTGPEGSARLRDASGDEVFLRERVKLEVLALTQTVAELLLTSGKVRASTGGERLAISAGGAHAVAPRGARFTIYADPRGAVAVASDAGEVKVMARGAEVAVGPNAQTFVEPGRPPEDPVAVPDEVFLAVAWPEAAVQQSQITLRGRTSRGADVAINGRPVSVGADGSFAVQVPLREGSNRVEVVAEPIVGPAKRVVRDVSARTTGPPLEADPSRLYDPPRKP